MTIASSDEIETHDDAIGRRCLAALVVGTAFADHVKTLRFIEASRRRILYADFKE